MDGKWLRYGIFLSALVAAAVIVSLGLTASGVEESTMRSVIVGGLFGFAAVWLWPKLRDWGDKDE